MTITVESVRARWARLGAGPGGEFAPESPDVERLIIDTVACSARSPQVVIAAVTWLSRFSNLVAEHRLEAMVLRESVDRARLGLLLSLAIENGRQHDRRRNLSRVLKHCAPSPDPRPFFDRSARSAPMIERAQRRASEISTEWQLWMDPIEAKFDAMRSIAWIIEHNPALGARADFRGDLRASLLLAIEHDAPKATITQLARITNASRLAVTHALDELELGGHVASARVGRTRVYEHADHRGSAA